MSNLEITGDPSFQAMVRASGLAEVWTHSTDAAKFNQFGWRCTNKETSYSNCTLIGNWNEERFDNKIGKQAKPLPSQVGFPYMYFFSLLNYVDWGIASPKLSVPAAGY